MSAPTGEIEVADQADARGGLPKVTEQLHADFTSGDELPSGSQLFDTGSNKSGMALTGGLLGHGDPVGPGAASFVETRLASDVRLLGARVRFPAEDSGSVALVAWQSSLVEAAYEGGATPATGLRLVASPGQWELSVVDGGEVHVIGDGTYAATEAAATFEVRRDATRLYVVDPEGTVTVVEDKRAVRLSGPWASWGLTETGPDQEPAAVEAFWAG